MIQAVKKDLETVYKDLYEQGKMILAIAHTENYDSAMDFKKQVQEAFPDMKIVFVDPLSLSVSCHIGPGSLALVCAPNIDNCIQ